MRDLGSLSEDKVSCFVHVPTLRIVSIAKTQYILLIIPTVCHQTVSPRLQGVKEAKKAQRGDVAREKHIHHRS